MDQDFHQAVDRRARQHCSAAAHHRSRRLLITMFCAVCVFQSATEAGAQCSARDALRNQLNLKTASSRHAPITPVRSIADLPVWKRITLGNYSDSLTLRNAMDAIGCHVGGSVAEILARANDAHNARSSRAPMRTAQRWIALCGNEDFIGISDRASHSLIWINRCCNSERQTCARCLFCNGESP